MHANLLSRLAFLATLFVLELLPITVWLDGEVLIKQGGMIGWLGLSGSWILRGVVTFAAAFVTFAILHVPERSRNALQRVSAQLCRAKAVSPIWLTAHIGSLALFGLLTHILFAATVSGSAATATALGWLIAGMAAIATGAGTIIPFRSWQLLLGATGNLWIYALATSLAADLLGAYARTLWTSAARGHFSS